MLYAAAIGFGILDFIGHSAAWAAADLSFFAVLFAKGMPVNWDCTKFMVTHSPEAAKSGSRLITVQDGMILSDAHAQSGSDSAGEKMDKTASSLSGISCKKNLRRYDTMFTQAMSSAKKGESVL